MLRALGKSPTEAEIRQIVKDIDPDNRGVVDYKEFEKIMTRDIRAYDNEQDLKSAWKVRANPHDSMHLLVFFGVLSETWFLSCGLTRACRRLDFGVGRGFRVGVDLLVRKLEFQQQGSWLCSQSSLCMPPTIPILQVFDKSGQGFISAAELKHVLTSVGEKLSPEEITEMMNEADPEKSGKILYDNFIKMMLAR